MLSASVDARADRLNELLFDYDAGRRFARSLQRSVMPLKAHRKAPENVEPSTVSPIIGFAVAVVDPAGGAPKLLTAGPLVAAASIDVRSPSGRWVRVETVSPIGDGALAVLEIADFWLWAELAPLELNKDIELKRTTPIFSVGRVESAFPVLIKGVVAKTIDMENVEGVFINDLRFVLGTPLVSAGRTVLGVNYRRAPDSEHRSLGIDSETIRAWLRPKGAGADRAAPAP